MKFYRPGIIILSYVLLTILSLNEPINRSLENLHLKMFGETEVDSNIVLIEITQDDIEKLGGFPIKRSYYALLLKKLSQLNPKVVGFEIFLSPTNTQQSVYNEVLLNQIKEFPNIVFSNFVDQVENKNDMFFGRKVNVSQPKIELNNVFDGHINYISENGLKIPESIIVGDKVIKSFSAQIYEKYSKEVVTLNEITLNCHTSYNNLNRIRLLDFLSTNNTEDYNWLKDKIVIIGVSEPTLAHSEKTAFDKELPGIGLHAFAVSNLLRGNYINSNFYLISSVTFLLIVLTLTITKRSYRTYLIISLFFILLFISLNLIFVRVDFTSFLIPFLSLTVFDAITSFLKKEEQLNIALIEKGKLEQTLTFKENELNKVKADLSNSGEKESLILKGQIRLLENEIENLKQIEADEISSEMEDISAKNFHGIVYKSEAIDRVTKLIEKTAPTDATVLILGESGSGKELVAKAVHELSKRKDQNFVAVNCAALTESLLESELFGHVKGAFTNAVADKKGRFELADKGTIFLDEIGETDDNFQAKLLRVLQSGEYERVGEGKALHTNARIIAATNKDLENLVKEKKFREDLYYRLNVIKIDLPPLRERKEDIEIIADHFLKRENSNLKFSKAVKDQICKTDWKGNVRELESVVKRAVIFANSENRKIIKLNDLPEELSKISSESKDTLILESLREKGFSHSSINETVKEMSGLSRTIVSETFRGISFQYYCENGFDLEKAVSSLAATNYSETINKVEKKLSTYLKNIARDIEKSTSSDFESMKKEFSSKYKNLPTRYHEYLDLIIKNFLNS